jgi:hypothetical protein
MPKPAPIPGHRKHAPAGTKKSAPRLVLHGGGDMRMHALTIPQAA